MGNPKDLGGYYFAEYDYRPGRYFINRQKGGFRNYVNYLQTGSAVYYTEKGPFTVNAGELYFMPMGISYIVHFKDAWIISCGFTHFPEARDKRYMPCKLPQQYVPTVQQIPKQVIPSCATLGKFYNLMAQLLPYLEESSAAYTPNLYEKLRAYLWHNYTQPLEKIAEYCEMSVANLYRTLSENGYPTPNQIKQEILVEKAQQLLADTLESVEQISQILDFSSANYFRKIFKQRTGISPLKYRRMVKSGKR